MHDVNSYHNIIHILENIIWANFIILYTELYHRALTAAMLYHFLNDGSFDLADKFP